VFVPGVVVVAPGVVVGVCALACPIILKAIPVNNIKAKSPANTLRGFVNTLVIFIPQVLSYRLKPIGVGKKQFRLKLSVVILAVAYTM
jgi:hypothetical protein